MKDLREPPQPDTCEPRTNAVGSPRTMYVHHCSGLITAVEEVTELQVTETQLVLTRGGEQPAVFARRDIYFACSEPDEQPAPC